MDLLDKHYAILSSSLRQSLVKSLILLRNRGHLKSAEVLPLFFRLFRCQDKSLRDLLFKHIVAGMPCISAQQPHHSAALDADTMQLLLLQQQYCLHMQQKQPIVSLTSSQTGTKLYL